MNVADQCDMSIVSNAYSRYSRFRKDDDLKAALLPNGLWEIMNEIYALIHGNPLQPNPVRDHPRE